MIGRKTLKRAIKFRVYYAMKLMGTAICAYLLATLALTGAEPKRASPGITPLEDPAGVHNLYALGTNLYSGSTPEGEAGFEALAKLGVKTIISVDGAKPEVDRAKKFGMRYVHLPHGYDGISTNLQLQLAKAAAELEGPMYVHCHHGKHRGPAAAAIICMAKESWGAAQAERWLQAAGTSTHYSGLYESIRNFKRPTLEQLKATPSNFPEAAKVSGLVDAMVGIDNSWEHLKAIRTAGYQAPKDHPDMQPANEAVILWEHYREAQRLADAKQHGADFIERLKTAENEGKEIERLLRELSAGKSGDIRARLDASFDQAGKSCASCHKAHRN